MSNHYHLLVQTPDPNLARAEEILKRGLEVIGENLEGLRSMAKNDERKQMIAWLIKNRTTVRYEWICKRMGMGHRSKVIRSMSRITESKVKDSKWNRRLHI